MAVITLFLHQPPLSALASQEPACIIFSCRLISLGTITSFAELLSFLPVSIYFCCCDRRAEGRCCGLVTVTVRNRSCYCPAVPLKLLSSVPFFPIVIHHSSNVFLTIDVAAAFPPSAALSRDHFRPPEDVCFPLQLPGLSPAALTSRICSELPLLWQVSAIQVCLFPISALGWF